MIDQLAENYARSQRQPMSLFPIFVATVGLAVGLSLFVFLFSTLAARSAMAVIEADRIVAGAAW